MEIKNEVVEIKATELEIADFTIEELEDRTAMLSAACATSSSCECTSTSCVIY